MNAKPFVQWSGGKRALVPELLKYIPNSYHTYIEPFVGGGALYFALSPKKSWLNDTNVALAAAYITIKDRPYEVIDALERHATLHEQSKSWPDITLENGSVYHGRKQYFYQVTESYNVGRHQEPRASEPKIVADLIFLSKIGFNGLYRENQKGMYNAAYGTPKDKFNPDSDNIEAVSDHLWSTDASITAGSFERIKAMGSHSFIYCDPPYYKPPNSKSAPINYRPSGFDEEQQELLRDTALRWHDEGAQVMISNSNTLFINDLYNMEPFIITPVNGRTTISGDSAARGKTSELIITTYA